MVLELNSFWKSVWEMICSKTKSHLRGFWTSHISTSMKGLSAGELVVLQYFQYFKAIVNSECKINTNPSTLLLQKLFPNYTHSKVHILVKSGYILGLSFLSFSGLCLCSSFQNNRGVSEDNRSKTSLFLWFLSLLLRH